MMLTLGRFWMKPSGFFLTLGTVILAFFFLFSTIYWKYQTLLFQEKTALALVERASITLPKRRARREFFTKYQSPQLDFVEKNLVPLTLLSEEKTLVKKALSHSIFCKEKGLHDAQKLFLDNALLYKQQKLPRSSFLKETVFVQKKPVFSSFSDLTHMIALVESAQYAKKRPQLLFTKVSLVFHQESIFPYFELHTELLQREFVESAP